jgi:hypothetical protein
MRRPKKKKPGPPAAPKLDVGKVYKVLHYHTGTFSGICTDTDRWSARIRVGDSMSTPLEVGEIVEVSLRLATFVEETV